LTLGYRFSDIQYFGGEPMMKSNPPHAFSVGIKLPLFTSGRTFETISEKKVDLAKAQNTFTDTENQLKIQDKQLRYNLNSAYESFQIQKKNIEVTDRVFNNVAEKFRYGKASSVDVTLASTDFITAQNTYIQALLDMVNAQIALRNLLNK
jgi:outer membrane protein TolC